MTTLLGAHEARRGERGERALASILLRDRVVVDDGSASGEGVFRNGDAGKGTGGGSMGGAALRGLSSGEEGTVGKANRRWCCTKGWGWEGGGEGGGGGVGRRCFCGGCGAVCCCFGGMLLFLWMSEVEKLVVRAKVGTKRGLIFQNKCVKQLQK